MIYECEDCGEVFGASEICDECGCCPVCCDCRLLEGPETDEWSPSELGEEE